jgi:hypothetical protein
MKQFLKFILPFVITIVFFSCAKEDIRPNEDNNNCTCQSDVDGKTGGSNNCTTLDDPNGEPPITDPNNDEDENKVIRKTAKN